MTPLTIVMCALGAAAIGVGVWNGTPFGAMLAATGGIVLGWALGAWEEL